jgi:hypothetical protein
MTFEEQTRAKAKAYDELMFTLDYHRKKIEMRVLEDEDENLDFCHGVLSLVASLYDFVDDPKAQEVEKFIEKHVAKDDPRKLLLGTL